MSDKLTNGQWYLTDHCQYTVSVKVYNDDYYQNEETIAKIPQGDKSEQYAHLIAAAPDLLDALESVWIWMESQSDAQSKGGHATFDLMELRKQRDIASVAIAKATGGAS